MLQPNCSETCEICGGYINCLPDCPNYYSDTYEDDDEFQECFDYKSAVDFWFEDAKTKLKTIQDGLDELEKKRISKKEKTDAKKD